MLPCRPSIMDPHPALPPLTPLCPALSACLHVHRGLPVLRACVARVEAQLAGGLL